MIPPETFEGSQRRQIEIHLARTPTERFLAFFELMAAIDAMEPKDPESAQLRRNAIEERRRRKLEGIRATFKRLMAPGRPDAAGGPHAPGFDTQ